MGFIVELNANLNTIIRAADFPLIIFLFYC